MDTFTNDEYYLITTIEPPKQIKLLKNRTIKFAILSLQTHSSFIYS